MNQRLSKRLAAEGVGTAMLLAAVVGSGIMGERLAAGNSALALLANSICDWIGPVFFDTRFRSASGAHFNPAVTLASALRNELAWADVASYAGAQLFGAFTGIRPLDAPLFIVAQLAGAFVATIFFKWLDDPQGQDKQT